MMKWHTEDSHTDKLPLRGLDCPEVNPVPVAYQRMNGSWVCAAGYAGSVQAVSCVCGVLKVVTWSCVLKLPSFRVHIVSSWTCEQKSFFTSQVKVKVSVNIGESPVLLKSNSVIQSVFSVSFPLFSGFSFDKRNVWMAAFPEGSVVPWLDKVTQVDCYLSSYCSSEPSLQGCSKQDRRVDESSHRFQVLSKTSVLIFESRFLYSMQRRIRYFETQGQIPHGKCTRYIQIHIDTSELETGALLSHRARPVCLWHLGLQRLENLVWNISGCKKSFISFHSARSDHFIVLFISSLETFVLNFWTFPLLRMSLR